MELLLRRNPEWSTEKATLGCLYIEQVFFCYTLEDLDRHLEDGGEKMPKETAIPRGKYQVIINYSNRFKKMMPLLLKVPQFEGIRIHSGNTEADTEGCILVGDQRWDGRVLKSRIAYNRLFERLAEVESIPTEEKIWIQIV